MTGFLSYLCTVVYHEIVGSVITLLYLIFNLIVKEAVFYFVAGYCFYYCAIDSALCACCVLYSICKFSPIDFIDLIITEIEVGHVSDAGEGERRQLLQPIVLHRYVGQIVQVLKGQRMNLGDRIRVENESSQLLQMRKRFRPNLTDVLAGDDDLLGLSREIGGNLG